MPPVPPETWYPPGRSTETETSALSGPWSVSNGSSAVYDVDAAVRAAPGTRAPEPPDTVLQTADAPSAATVQSGEAAKTTPEGSEPRRTVSVAGRLGEPTATRCTPVSSIVVPLRSTVEVGDAGSVVERSPRRTGSPTVRPRGRRSGSG